MFNQNNQTAEQRMEHASERRPGHLQRSTTGGKSGKHGPCGTVKEGDQGFGLKQST